MSAPEEFPQSALLPYNPAAEFTSAYGPLWTSICGPLAAMLPASPFALTLAFKLLGGACALAAAWLISRCAGSVEPGRAAQAGALFAWNPLVLFEGVGSGRLDALVAALAAGGYPLLLRRRMALSCLLLAACCLVKLSAAPVLLRYGALILLVAAFAYAPYWEGAATFGDLNARRLRTLSGFPPSLTFVGSVLAGLPRSWARTARPPTLPGEGAAWGASLVLLAYGPYMAYAWYALPGIALLAAARPSSRRPTVLLLGSSAGWFLLWYALVLAP